eukprot:1557984-Amphidinium_carterae.1
MHYSAKRQAHQRWSIGKDVTTNHAEKQIAGNIVGSWMDAGEMDETGTLWDDWVTGTNMLRQKM